jgi:hypothetical protein
MLIMFMHKSSQVNTPPNAKSQAKDKRAKDRQKYAALRCKVGVAVHAQGKHFQGKG